MSAIKDQWCSCTRLREAEAKAALLDELLANLDCQPWGLFKCRNCEFSFGFTCMAVDYTKEKLAYIERRQP